MEHSKTPADLMASSKQKFVLSQARLQPGKVELALLSLHGSLQDGLRAYLLLHGRPAAEKDLSGLIAALADDSKKPLVSEHADRLQHMSGVWERIVQGEAVTLTYESIERYQQLVADVLIRYGVLVVKPEPQSETTAAPSGRQARKQTRSERYEQYDSGEKRRPSAAFFFSLLLGVLVLVGTATVLALNQPAIRPHTLLPDLAPATESSSDATEPDSTAPPAATSARPDTLSPGRTALVSTTDGEDLALREWPDTTGRSTIRLYLKSGTAVQVVEGPVSLDGSDWWKVRVANQEGWCRGEFLKAR
jgi:hypothetical protein